MERGTLVVRADAGLKMGTGHVMRCLALAQAWRRGGCGAVFAMAESTPAMDGLLRSQGITVTRIEGEPGGSEDASHTLAIARAFGADWLVVDGYQFDAEYQRRMQSLRPVLAVDDNGPLDYYSAELVLNQNAHACPEMYARVSPNTQLLLGPRFALLRDEFAAYRKWARTIPERGSRLLLTLGGSDAANFAPRILPFLAKLPTEDLQIRIVVGGSAENCGVVDAIAEKCARRVEVLRDVKNMADMMAWADLAISAAGTTSWEMCGMGLPAILVVVAENQKFIAEHLAVLGAVENAGCADRADCAALAELCGRLLVDKSRRAGMSQRARLVVDGRGRERVLSMMKRGDEMCA